MTYLDTDKQTQADLSITEGIYDEYPLYSLFSGTETKNGKRMMLDWITSPLNDISAIRKRQEAIAWKELPELPWMKKNSTLSNIIWNIVIRSEDLIF